VTRGVGLIIASCFFVIAIVWIGCEQHRERQCRDKEWRWDEQKGCVEP
jgi:hypothetical protein